VAAERGATKGLCGAAADEMEILIGYIDGIQFVSITDS